MDLSQEQDSAFGAADIITFIVPFSPKHSVLPSQAPQLSFSSFSFLLPLSPLYRSIGLDEQNSIA